jgi:hypothetical protein
MLFAPAAVVLLILLLFVAHYQRRRRRRRGEPSPRGPGPGAAGAVYELLNEDRRRALEIIVEEKAAATDPEHADDMPPDLKGR